MPAPSVCPEPLGHLCRQTWPPPLCSRPPFHSRNASPSDAAEPAIGGRGLRPSFAFTFVQPVAEPVEDAALFAGGNQTYGSTLHRRAVVDVVLKNEDLEQEKDRTPGQCLSPHAAH